MNPVAQDLTVPEVAAQLQCSEKKVRRLAKKGDIPAYRLGRELRFKPDAVDRLRARTAVMKVEQPQTPIARASRKQGGQLKGWNKFS